MSHDTRKDRLLGAIGCLGLAAMLGTLAAWAWTGVFAAEADFERFEDSRGRGQIVGFSTYLIPVASLLTLATLGLLGMAVWMVGVRRSRTGTRR